VNLYPYPRPFQGDPFDVEPDTEHPGMDGYAAARMVVERHIHLMRVDATDEWAYVPVTAVHWDGIGQVVEIGPWSLNPADARLLARSLVILADLVDVNCPTSLLKEN
jgi:hypothetical protein